MAAHSLSEDFRKLLAGSENQELKLGMLVDRVGEKGFGMLLVLLALPSALPIPAPGYSTPFGIMLALLAVQMIGGRHVPIFPERFRKMKINRKLADNMLKFAASFFQRIEFMIKPRMKWIGGKVGKSLMGWLVLIMACLMILPIPYTNTFPAMVIFLLGIGLMEEDGLFSLFACVIGFFALCLYGFIIYVVIAYGPHVVTQGVEAAKEWIKGMMGIAPEPDPAAPPIEAPSTLLRGWLFRRW
ncbi:MAG: exopolysaccharide biosynthesis protein [Verrucomicrobiota bacterium JB022]|nr:exopolysaccharide biosynthesis protein [Verrucomicrobiota bacterium JB022]